MQIKIHYTKLYFLLISISFFTASSCFSPSLSAQSKEVFMFDMKYVAGMTEYHSFMMLSPGIRPNVDGVMRTKYYQPDIRQTVIVEQELKVENTTRGMRIAGYYPQFIRTDGSKVSARGYYSPDNFYIRYDTHGNPKITNIDEQGVSAKVDAELVNHKDSYLLAAYLIVFKWDCLLDGSCGR